MNKIKAVSLLLKNLIVVLLLFILYKIYKKYNRESFEDNNVPVQDTLSSTTTPLAKEKPSTDNLAPGCYILLPDGCPYNKQSVYNAVNYWKKDTDAPDIQFNQSICLNRKDDWNKKCGVSNTEMFYKDVTEVAEAPEPNLPGCFFKSQRGCDLGHGFKLKFGKWTRDTTSRTNDTDCKNRANDLKKKAKCQDIDYYFKKANSEPNKSNLGNLENPELSEQEKQLLPKRKGCYVKFPSGCNLDPRYKKTSSWEEYPDSEDFEKQRCLNLKYYSNSQYNIGLNDWCNNDDIQIYYKDKDSPPPPQEKEPVTRGCYLKSTRGCLGVQDGLPGGKWVRDTSGKETSEDKCKARKENLEANNKYCKDLNYFFSNGSYYIGKKFEQKELTEEEKKAVPKENGCYVKFPTGCNHSDKYSKNKWEKILNSDINDDKVCKDLLNSKEDTIGLNEYCGVEDANTFLQTYKEPKPTFKPISKEDIPKQPGCFLRAKKDCEVGYGNEIIVDWQRDTSGARTEQKCTERKDLFEEKCGEGNIQSLFNPYPTTASPLIPHVAKEKINLPLIFLQVSPNENLDLFEISFRKPSNTYPYHLYKYNLYFGSTNNSNKINFIEMKEDNIKDDMKIVKIYLINNKELEKENPKLKEIIENSIYFTTDDLDYNNFQFYMTYEVTKGLQTEEIYKSKKSNKVITKLNPSAQFFKDKQQLQQTQNAIEQKKVDTVLTNLGLIEPSSNNNNLAAVEYKGSIQTIPKNFLLI